VRILVVMSARIMAVRMIFRICLINNFLLISFLENCYPSILLGGSEGADLGMAVGLGLCRVAVSGSL